MSRDPQDRCTAAAGGDLQDGEAGCDCQEARLQVSAGDGPAGCARAVLEVAERVQNDAVARGLDFRTLDLELGPKPGTAQRCRIRLACCKAPAGLCAMQSSDRERP
jgi:hypothetical protein